MRILIAEDDAASRRILAAMLVKWGYDVVSAADGGEAWEMLHDPDAPRLVVLDWMMPGIDGVDLCRRLGQAHTTTPSLRHPPDGAWSQGRHRPGA